MWIPGEACKAELTGSPRTPRRGVPGAWGGRSRRRETEEGGEEREVRCRGTLRATGLSLRGVQADGSHQNAESRSHPLVGRLLTLDSSVSRMA